MTVRSVLTQSQVQNPDRDTSQAPFSVYATGPASQLYVLSCSLTEVTAPGTTPKRYWCLLKQKLILQHNDYNLKVSVMYCRVHG